MKWTFLGFLVLCMIVGFAFGLSYVVDEFPKVFITMVAIFLSYAFGIVIKSFYHNRKIK